MTLRHTKHNKSEKAKDLELGVSLKTEENVKVEDTYDTDPDVFCGVHRSILEAFDNLNWYDNIPPELNESFIPPEELSNLHTFKLIDSKLVTIHTSEYKIPPMPEREEEVATYLPGLKPNYQFCVPKRSVLKWKEQAKLFQFYYRISNISNKNCLPLNKMERSEFQLLRSRVFSEYAEFQEFAKSEWYKGHWKRTLEIPLGVEKYIDNLWLMRAGQCMISYPDEYKSVLQIPLALNDPNQDFSVMDFVKHVYIKSLPPKISLPRVKKRYDLISGFEELSQIKPVSGDLANRPKPVTTFIPRASFDHIVDDLLHKDDLDIDVVISMSGIKTLVDNFKFQREWTLPVTVKNIVKSNGETRKKVVIIDKNLPPKSLSVHEKNLWHAKIASKWMLILNEFPCLLNKREKQSTAKGDHEGILYNDLSEAVDKLNIEKSSASAESKIKVKPKDETLNEVSEKLNTDKFSEKVQNKRKQLSKSTESVVSLGKQMKTEPSQVSQGQRADLNKQQATSLHQNDLKKRREKKKLMSYDDPFIDNGVEDIEEFGVDPGSKRNVRSQEANKKEKACRKHSVESSSGKKIPEKEANPGCPPAINFGEPSTKNSVRPKLNPSATKKEMQKPCVQYQLWKLHKSKYLQLLKFEQRSLNLLVRTRKDGLLYRLEDNTWQGDDICVSSKLEFQPEYGASTMSASELTREYLDLYMRPSSKLVRVRSVGHTKEVMMTEVKSISEIRDALQTEERNVQKLFDPLYAVLTKLIDLHPGRYMLHHTVKMGPFATLLLEQPGWTNFNLPHYCSKLTQAEVNVPPTPIDPLVLTPLQHRDKVPPALFYPAYNQENTNVHFRKPVGLPVSVLRKSRKKKSKNQRKKSNKEKSKEKLSEAPDLLTDSGFLQT